MDMLQAGVVGSARGLKGEVSIDLRTDRPEHCFQPGAIVKTNSSTFPQLTVEGFSSHRGRALVFFAEIVTREQAEELRGTELLVEAVPEEDAWYSHELEGLSAVDPEGTTLGTVKELRLGAAQDLLVIEMDGREVLVPFVDALVPRVAVAEGIVVVDAPDGLFDESLG